MPPSLANRLALSREINDSRPILTRDVFSLTPVSSDALLRIPSSILIVVLICIYMHYLYIYVKTSTPGRRSPVLPDAVRRIMSGPNLTSPG